MALFTKDVLGGNFGESALTGSGSMTKAQKMQKKLDDGATSIVTLRYPAEVGDSDQGFGHYIVIKIWDNRPLSEGGPTGGEITNAELVAGKNVPVNRGAKQKTKQLMGIANNMVDTGKRIVLYMPEGLTASYGTNWELGTVSAFAGGLASKVMKAGSVSDVTHGFKTAAEIIAGAADYAYKNPGAVVDRALRGSVDLVQDVLNDETLTNTAQVLTRTLINPHMEFVFKGVETRKFEFGFKFTPKTEEEAESVYEIIKTLKTHMHPDIKTSVLDNDSGFTMFYTYPSEFDVMFMSHGKENRWMHKISTCALTGLEVNYAGGNTNAFLRDTQNKGSPPAITELSLTFTELEILTRSRIEEGF